MSKCLTAIGIKLDSFKDPSEPPPPPTSVSCHFQSRKSLELQHFFGNVSFGFLLLSLPVGFWRTTSFVNLDVVDVRRATVAIQLACKNISRLQYDKKRILENGNVVDVTLELGQTFRLSISLLVFASTSLCHWYFRQTFIIVSVWVLVYLGLVCTHQR